MDADKPRKKVSKTEDTEYGYYIRKRTRYGKHRKQRTTRLKPNPSKVKLGSIGTFEVYAYPDQFPDKVFIGIYPLSESIEEYQKEDFLRIYNKIKWYFAEHWQKSGRTTKGAKSRRQAILRSVSAGVDKRKEANLKRDSLN